ncbi:MAG: sensor domain-containing diguanylate cyclase [Deltaproteobacteria bacterium]|nr:sensor domain-containing diguanylate cyclase [Deltaproteobacteria bacterium]
MSQADLKPLVELAHAFRREQSLEEMLQATVDTVARVLETPRASIRLLDADGRRLLAMCRAGEPLHSNPSTAFQIGEGMMGWIAQHQQPILVDDAEADERFVSRPGKQSHAGAFVGVPLISEGNCMGVISAVEPEVGSLGESDLEILELIAGICEPHIHIARLKRLTQVDALTGALNRRGLDLAMPQTYSPSVDEREGKVVSVMMADIDHFKRVNDTYGHAVGDLVLHKVTLVLGETLRFNDSVIRYGGEEFLLVLPGMRLGEAAMVAERARAAVEETVFEVEGRPEPIQVTISIGAAQRREGEQRDSLIERADAALYEAKEAGRNRVVTSDE